MKSLDRYGINSLIYFDYAIVPYLSLYIEEIYSFYAFSWRIFITTAQFLQRLPSGYRSCCNQNRLFDKENNEIMRQWNNGMLAFIRTDPIQATSHYLNQWCLVYWSIYASLGLVIRQRWSLNACTQSNTKPVKLIESSVVYMRQHTMPSLVRITACSIFHTNPLSQPMLPCCQLDHWEHISV